MYIVYSRSFDQLVRTLYSQQRIFHWFIGGVGLRFQKILGNSSWNAECHDFLGRRRWKISEREGTFEKAVLESLSI